MKGVKTLSDVDTFQAVIAKFVNWQSTNNMWFNAGKFQLLRLGKDQALIDSTILHTGSPLDPLVPVSEVKDLGVIVDNMASFKAH